MNVQGSGYKVKNLSKVKIKLYEVMNDSFIHVLLF